MVLEIEHAPLDQLSTSFAGREFELISSHPFQLQIDQDGNSLWWNASMYALSPLQLLNCQINSVVEEVCSLSMLHKAASLYSLRLFEGTCSSWGNLFIFNASQNGMNSSLDRRKPERSSCMKDGSLGVVQLVEHSSTVQTMEKEKWDQMREWWTIIIGVVATTMMAKEWGSWTTTATENA